MPEATPVIALTADPLGRAARDLGRAQNFSRIVPSMGDEFDGGPDPDGDALTAGGEAATMAGLREQAAALAGRTGLGDTDRLLSGRPLLTVGGAAAGLLAPLARGAGVVLVSNLDPAKFWKRVADERVTVAVLEPAQAAAVRDAGPPPPELDRSRLRVVLDD
jgi:acyl-CoA synthetase (AMP-forming)/AMP-acid ligase II